MASEPMKFQFDRSKFKEMVLYICENTDASDLGSVKLHKTLYFSDMMKYVWDGAPISGEMYRKSPLGPTSHHLYWTLKQLEQEEALQIKETEYFGYLKKEYITKRNADRTRFSGSELQLIDEVIDFVCRNNTAKEISEISHTRAWELAKLGAEIPYHSAFAIFPHFPSDEGVDWAYKQGEEIEAERSRSDPMDYEQFAAFRRRVSRLSEADT
jgi:uncharacterized phage-associated protein